MAQLTLNYPDDKEQRFLNAFASVYGWTQENELTKKQFMKSKLKDYMKEVLYRSEVSTAHQQASNQLQTEIDNITVD